MFIHNRLLISGSVVSGLSDILEMGYTYSTAEYPMYFLNLESGVLKENNNTVDISEIDFSNIRELGENVLSYAYSRQNNVVGDLTFPDLEVIGIESLSYAFRSTSITSVSFPELQYVYADGLRQTFHGCSNITSVSFPKLTKVYDNTVSEQYTFAGTSLQAVAFPRLTEIGKYGLAHWFYNYYEIPQGYGIEQIDFSSLQTVGEGGLSNTFRNVNNNSYYGSNFPAGSNASISFPSLTNVATDSFNETFKNCVGITSASFPLLTSITTSAFTSTFSGCTGLTSSAITNVFYNLETIGSPNNYDYVNPLSYTFKGCTGLTGTINVFPNLRNIYGNGGLLGTFEDCSNITTVVFPALRHDNQTYSANPLPETFRGCTSLTNVNYPSMDATSAQSVGKFAITFTETFYGCTSITDIHNVLPEGLDYENSKFKTTFAHCTGLTSVSVPEITSNCYFDTTFSGCTGLTSVSFPNLVSTTSSGSFSETFEYCTSLISVSFPLLETIDGFLYTFSGCTALTNISFPVATTLRYVSAMFDGCTNLTSVSFPSLQEITNDTTNPLFGSVPSLTTISFPSLTTLSISAASGSRTGYIGSLNNAFNGCTGLTEIHFPSALATQYASILTVDYLCKPAWYGDGEYNANLQILFDL